MDSKIDSIMMFKGDFPCLVTVNGQPLSAEKAQKMPSVVKSSPVWRVIL
jgi:hypothetical protein